MAVYHHISVQVKDLEKGRAFYDPLLATLGMKSFAGYHNAVAYGSPECSFWVHAPEKGAVIGGGHVCFAADTRAAVDAFYKAAIAADVKVEEAPKGRHNSAFNKPYYTALVHDPDGNRIEVATFAL